MAELTSKVTFKKVSAKALVQTVSGPEQAYPVYRFSGRYKWERPEVPGSTYRRYQ